MQIIMLKIEKNGKTLWGRVMLDHNLIVADVPTIEQLEIKMRKLIKDFHNLDNVGFEIC